MTKKRGDRKQLIYSHMRKVQTNNFGDKYYSVSLWKKSTQ